MGAAETGWERSPFLPGTADLTGIVHDQRAAIQHHFEHRAGVLGRRPFGRRYGYQIAQGGFIDAQDAVGPAVQRQFAEGLIVDPLIEEPGPLCPVAEAAGGAAEHLPMIDEEGAESGASFGAQKEGLAAVLVVGPQVQQKHAEEVLRIGDAREPATGDEFVDAAARRGTDQARAEVQARIRAHAALRRNEPHLRMGIEEVIGHQQGLPGGDGQPQQLGQFGPERLMEKCVLAMEMIVEFQDVRVTVRRGDQRALRAAPDLPSKTSYKWRTLLMIPEIYQWPTFEDAVRQVSYAGSVLTDCRVNKLAESCKYYATTFVAIGTKVTVIDRNGPAAKGTALPAAKGTALIEKTSAGRESSNRWGMREEDIEKNLRANAERKPWSGAMQPSSPANPSLRVKYPMS
jgi:hypothetical protein